MKRKNVFLLVIAIVILLGWLLPYLTVNFYSKIILKEKIESFYEELQGRSSAIENAMHDEISRLKFNCDIEDLKILRDLNSYNSQFRVQGIEMKNGGGCSSLGPDLTIVSTDTHKNYVYKFRGYDVGVSTTNGKQGIDGEAVAFINVNGNLVYWVLNSAWVHEKLQSPCKGCFYIEYLNVSPKEAPLFMARGNLNIKTQPPENQIFTTLSDGKIIYKLVAGQELRNYSLSVLKSYSMIATSVLLILIVTSFWIYDNYQNSVEGLLKSGLRKREFIPFYQPVVDAVSGKVIGAEALLRWKRKGEIVPPGSFIEHAESNGLILEITEQILEQIIKDLNVIPEDIWISVNVVPAQVENGSLFNMLMVHRWKYNSRLRFEVTERMKVNDFTVAGREISKIKSLGYRFKLDDFGTGYGGFSYIQRLGIDEIKIDKMFVDTIGTSDVKKGVLDSIIAFAIDSNMEPVAEGVETKEQLDYLLGKGIHRIQGFIYSKPLPLNEFTNWVRLNSGRL